MCCQSQRDLSERCVDSEVEVVKLRCSWKLLVGKDLRSLCLNTEDAYCIEEY